MKRAGAHCVAMVVPQGSVSTQGEGKAIYNILHVHVHVEVKTIRYKEMHSHFDDGGFSFLFPIEIDMCNGQTKTFLITPIKG